MDMTHKPSEEVLLSPSQALAVATPTEMSTMLAYAKALSDANLLPRSYQKNPANVLWAVEYARTLNLTPIAAMAGVHVIDGKPSASSALISALVRRAGHKLRVTGDSKSATATIVRSDDPEFTFSVTWTFQMAKDAGLTGKAVWKAYPDAMLKARAITAVARDACQEALFGLLYTPEELGATVDGDGNPILSTQGEVIVGEVEEAPAEGTITILPEVITSLVEKIIKEPLGQLREVGLEVNRLACWGHRTSELAGSPTVREVFVNRLGDDLSQAEVKATPTEIWSLIKGFGLTQETFTFADGNEDVTVILGEYCIERGKSLPKELAEPAATFEPVSENARQLQTAAAESWGDDARAVLTEAGLAVDEVVEGVVV